MASESTLAGNIVSRAIAVVDAFDGVPTGDDRAALEELQGLLQAVLARDGRGLSRADQKVLGAVEYSRQASEVTARREIGPWEFRPSDSGDGWFATARVRTLNRYLLRSTLGITVRASETADLASAMWMVNKSLFDHISRKEGDI